MMIVKWNLLAGVVLFELVNLHCWATRVQRCGSVPENILLFDWREKRGMRSYSLVCALKKGAGICTEFQGESVLRVAGGDHQVRVPNYNKILNCRKRACIVLCASQTRELCCLDNLIITLKMGIEPGDENNTIDNQVFIAGCAEPPCKIMRNSTVNVEIHFQPEYDVNRLINSVYAWVLTIPFPHYGVDGTTACNTLFTAPTMSKASCPVRKGQKYIYRNSVEIKATYPKVKTTLHWALLDAKNNAPVFCFEVPVKIIT